MERGKEKSKISRSPSPGGNGRGGKIRSRSHQRGLQHVEIVLPHQPVDVDGVQEPPVQPRAARLEAERRPRLGWHLAGLGDVRPAGRVRRRHRRRAVRRCALPLADGVYASPGRAGADLVRSFTGDWCTEEVDRARDSPRLAVVQIITATCCSAP